MIHLIDFTLLPFSSEWINKQDQWQEREKQSKASGPVCAYLWPSKELPLDVASCPWCCKDALWMLDVGCLMILLTPYGGSSLSRSLLCLPSSSLSVPFNWTSCLSFLPVFEKGRDETTSWLHPWQTDPHDMKTERSWNNQWWRRHIHWLYWLASSFFSSPSCSFLFLLLFSFSSSSSSFTLVFFLPLSLSLILITWPEL